MDVIRHHAEGVELEAELIQGFLDGVEKNLPTFEAGEFEFAVIAASGERVWYSCWHSCS